MISYKLVKHYGIILSLAGGLSSCYMYDDLGNKHNEASTNQQMHGHQVKGPVSASQPKVMTSAKKSNVSSNEPVQARTPGPKGTAAPQLPVIPQ